MQWRVSPPTPDLTNWSLTFRSSWVSYQGKPPLLWEILRRVITWHSTSMTKQIKGNIHLSTKWIQMSGWNVYEIHAIIHRQLQERFLLNGNGLMQWHEIELLLCSHLSWLSKLSILVVVLFAEGFLASWKSKGA